MFHLLINYLFIRRQIIYSVIQFSDEDAHCTYTRLHCQKGLVQKDKEFILIKATCIYLFN